MTTEQTTKETPSAPLVMKVEALVPLLQIGRSMAYELVRSGKIRSIRIGNRYRIPMDAVTEYLQNN